MVQCSQGPVKLLLRLIADRQCGIGTASIVGWSVGAGRRDMVGWLVGWLVG